ncbi:MAG: amidase [Hyphomicrobiales bacterium]|nr:amidase [Hyphomicrobiales bacterium]
MAGNVERSVVACLDRIAQRESAVGAWAFLDRDAALAQARSLDASSGRGPLHGMAIGIKDVIATADMPTEYGSPIYAGHRPAWDAACVSAIRAAGGVVLGKTVTTEFAASHPGKTRNPYNLAHTPGGSSSGSAAAVADGMVPLALGTQTGGSVIRPASFCGVVGYKPSFGFVSRHGVKPLSESLDTVGVFARSVREVGLLAAVIARRPELALGAAEPATGSVRVGLWRTHDWSEALPETAAAMDETTQLLAAAGASMGMADIPQALTRLGEIHRTIEHFEMVQSLAFELAQHRERLSRRLRERLEHAEHITPRDYEAARHDARACRKLLCGAFGQFDVLLTPAATGEAPRGLDGTGNSIFNRGWTLLGLPCITLPGFRGPQGLPVGIQLVGASREDTKLLAVAAWIEKRLPQ